jgi:hypothetical protein
MTFINDITVTLADGPQSDSFGRSRVSVLTLEFNSKLLNDKLPLFWDEDIAGTGTSVHSVANAAVTMSVSANNDHVIRQTFLRWNYRPGASIQFFFTFLLGTVVANVTKRIGFFNSNTTTPFNSTLDGFYLEDNGTDVGLVISKNGVANRIAQSAWNIDKFDGTGPSGITIDFTKVQLMSVDMAWLGVGRVRVGFDIGGEIQIAHEFVHANINTSVFMSSPNHSCRYEIRSTGGSGSIDHICTSVATESIGAKGIGPIRSRDQGVGTSNMNVVGSFYATVGIRLKSTHSNVKVVVESISVVNITNAGGIWRLLLNPTVAGTFTYTDVANSAVQYASGNTVSNPSTNTVTGGVVIDGGYYSSAQATTLKIESAIHLGVSLAGVRDTLVLVMGFFTSNEDGAGSLTWREEI